MHCGLMKQFIFSILLAFLTLSVALGQRGSLKGVIVDEYTAENIPFATIAITKSGEEVFFTGTVSDHNGEFLLENLPFGIYQVEVSFIGYNSRQIPDVTLSSANRNNDLGSIELELSAIGLEQVEVRAAAMTSVNRIDRTTYRASDFETARGGSALDVLSRLPSVTIRGEDEISVRGSSDFAVYLNGKPTNMSASMLLGQIPGDNIESIDIITVPTSRFEAQGHAGIINITTKRYTNTGLTIMATGMLGGTPWNNGTDVLSNHVLNNNMVNGGLSMNYNFNRVNLHGSINYSDRNDKGIGEVNSYIYQDVSQPLANTFYHFNGTGARPRFDRSLYTNIGADFTFAANSELSANFQYSNRHTGRAAHYIYNTFYSNGIEGTPIAGTPFEIYNPNDGKREGTFQNLNLDYKLNMDNNSIFTVSFLYENSDLEEKIKNKEFAYLGDRLYYDYYSEAPGDPMLYSFQRDGTPLTAYRFALNYQKKLENGNSIALGATSQNVRLDGIYEFDTFNTNTGQFEGNDYFNNAIDLKRDVYAAFAEYSGNKNKLSYILGLRTEYLDQMMNVSSTRYFEDVYKLFGELGRDFNENEFKQNNVNLFPSFHLRYIADEKNTISLAASRRINRPPAKGMAPFLYRRHQEIFEMGDPLLEPEYSWNADITYNRYLDLHSFSLTGFLRSASNAIYRVNRLDYNLANPGGVLFRTYTNAGNQLAAGGELGFNLFFFNKLKIFTGGSLYRFSVESNENLFGDQSRNSSINWDAKANLSLAIIDPLAITLDYSYVSKSVTPQGESLPLQMLNIALNYSPNRFNGWRFHAKVLDIIGTNQTGGYIKATEGLTSLLRRGYVYDYEGRIVEFGVTYTFNYRDQKKQPRRIIGTEFF